MPRCHNATLYSFSRRDQASTEFEICISHYSHYSRYCYDVLLVDDDDTAFNVLMFLALNCFVVIVALLAVHVVAE